MSADLTACLDFTLSYEGGFVDNSKDPGGATIWGITLVTFRAWMKNAKLGVASLRKLTKAQAETLYRLQYYLPVRADAMPPGLDLMVGDLAVNAGCRQSVVLLQRVLNVTEDGVVGPETVAASQSCASLQVIGSLGAAQQQFYRDLSLFSVFGRGWLARVDARTTTALNMAQ